MFGRRSRAAWRAASPSELDWIRELGGEVGSTGFDVAGFEDSVWVLNAMYERADGGAGLTHDEVLHLEVDSGARERVIIGDVDLTDVGVVIGNGLGWSADPGPGYGRLMWRDLAQRSGVAMVAPGEYPGYNSFRGVHPSGSWPEHIEPPTEGSMDVASWLALATALIQQSPAGVAAECIAYFTPWAGTSPDYLLQGRLRDAGYLVSGSPWGRSPQSLWPTDRSWFVYTDYDLWATRVSGSGALIASLLASTDLEAVRLPETPGPRLGAMP